MALVSLDSVNRSIRIVRGQQVILDSDIAALYGVPTRALNQAVVRNRERFPTDFMFRLGKEEFRNWRSQIVISNPRAKMSVRQAPYAFTEQGVAMLSSVLRSKRAVQVNIAIMRSFVRMRKVLASQGLLDQVEELKSRYGRNFKNVFEAVEEFRSLFEAIYMLMLPKEGPRSPIGFIQDDAKK